MPQTATLTQPAAANTSAVLVAASNSRHGVYIFNGGSTTLNIAFAGTASAAIFTTQIATGTGWNLDPASNYGGPISGIWSGSPTGNAAVTVW